MSRRRDDPVAAAAKLLGVPPSCTDAAALKSATEIARRVRGQHLGDELQAQCRAAAERIMGVVVWRGEFDDFSVLAIETSMVILMELLQLDASEAWVHKTFQMMWMAGKTAST